MKPLHAQISEYIMTKIQSGEWPVGHMLPTELELCEQFGISRSSVRTAMMSLVNDGYLKRVKGKGTFVTNPMRLEDTTIFIESFAEDMKFPTRSSNSGSCGARMRSAGHCSCRRAAIS